MHEHAQNWQKLIERFTGLLVTLPRRAKQIVAATTDSLILVIAIWVSYCLRFGIFYMPTTQQIILFITIPVIAIPIFIRMGVYRTIIRFANDAVYKSVIKALIITTLIWVTLAYMGELQNAEGVPRTIPFLFLITGSFMISASRFMAHAFLGQTVRSNISRERIAIYGVGKSAVQLVSALRDSHDILPFAVLDDTKAIQNTEMCGFSVLHSTALASLVENYGISRLIVCSDAVDRKTRRNLVSLCQKLDLKIQILPNLEDIFSGKHLISQIRQFDVHDLLGRKKIPPRRELLSIAITGKTVLVTGAGGSIGSELSRQVASLNPKQLILNDSSEFSLYEIERKLKEIPNLDLHIKLGSITSQNTIAKLFANKNIDTIFHAAAYKHVAMLEKNPVIAVENNIFGSRLLIDAAKQKNVERFILISTDKAVHPTSVMGATKRWAEILACNNSEESNRHSKNNSSCLFSIVRFGNVLNSRGSVAPLFQEQIQKRLPITITDAKMTRYFMSIAEASELIIQAAGMSEGKDIFLLDMGKPVPIIELARSMVQLAGLSLKDDQHPDGDIEIIEIGKRSGEKLSEELFYLPEKGIPTRHPKILRAKHSQNQEASIDKALSQLQKAVDANDATEVKNILFGFLTNRASQANYNASEQTSYT